MKAYVLTEDQMHAYWALEREAGKHLGQVSPGVDFAEAVGKVRDANRAAEDLPTEGAARLAAERLTHPGRGWVDDPGSEGGLIAAAVCYADDAGPHSMTVQIADEHNSPSLWPWAGFYWHPGTVERDLEKAGALIAAALDVIEAAK